MRNLAKITEAEGEKLITDLKRITKRLMEDYREKGETYEETRKRRYKSIPLEPKLKEASESTRKKAGERR